MILLYVFPCASAMDGLDGFGVRSFADAEPHLLVEVDEGAQEAHVVLVLDRQVESVPVEHVVAGDEHATRGWLVAVHEQWHRRTLLLVPDQYDPGRSRCPRCIARSGSASRMAMPSAGRAFSVVLRASRGDITPERALCVRDMFGARPGLTCAGLQVTHGGVEQA